MRLRFVQGSSSRSSFARPDRHGGGAQSAAQLARRTRAVFSLIIAQNTSAAESVHPVEQASYPEDHIM
jgi:hypothetical protein